MNDETQQLREEVAVLREQVSRLRQEVDATDDWANGLFQVLVTVLPPLLKGHPQADHVYARLQRATETHAEMERYHAAIEDDGVRKGVYEASAKLYSLLTLSGLAPDRRNDQ